ncbi:MAG: hypothetical protein RMK91_02945 [Pseudanabaenaceae cyanobacterium SKYGB_i_bin29]|nr:hypothetical protein [Pseudanabaenaceae cyanobacterium SKYG29]MDW8420801.1 hypothetical protein [Pseudanabaenaceae cyanobacterium SKYGB_i_bin29]
MKWEHSGGWLNKDRRERTKIAAATAILGGLKIIKQILRRNMMYQEILEEGRQLAR